MDHAVSGFEEVACALCGSEETDAVVAAPNRDSTASQDRHYQVVRCRRCGLHYQNPRPSIERLHEFYPEQYYAYQPAAPKSLQGLKAFGHRLEWWTKMGLRRAFWGYPCPGGRTQRWVLRLILWPMWLRMWLLGKDTKVIPYQGRGRFLDVGCGTGQELAYQRQYGLTVLGVERSASAARLAREQYGLDVRTGTLEQIGFPDRSLDLVYMSHVFEHLPNPASALDELHRILDTDGLVILKVPNIASESAKRFGAYWLGLDLPRHVYHFNPPTITRLLEQHGFRVKKIRQEVGSWSFWRESRRFQAQDMRKGPIHDPWWLASWSKLAEAVSCLKGKGSVIVVYAQQAV